LALGEHGSILGSRPVEPSGRWQTRSHDRSHDVAERLGLPFPILSDSDLELTTALRLPTFEVAEQTLLKRHTLVLRDGAIEHFFDPVFPPDRHAAEVLDWLRAQRR
jgi:peroxiredoxin